MAKNGRPSKLKPLMAGDKVATTIDMDRLAKLIRRGFTDAEVASYLDVCLDTFSEWKRKNREFYDSVKAWKNQADERVEASLFERAIGYEHPEDDIKVVKGEIVVTPTVKRYAPDTVACIFWLKNRQPRAWRDKQDVKVEGEGLGDAMMAAKARWEQWAKERYGKASPDTRAQESQAQDPVQQDEQDGEQV